MGLHDQFYSGWSCWGNPSFLAAKHGPALWDFSKRWEFSLLKTNKEEDGYWFKEEKTLHQTVVIASENVETANQCKYLESLEEAHVESHCKTAANVFLIETGFYCGSNVDSPFKAMLHFWFIRSLETHRVISPRSGWALKLLPKPPWPDRPAQQGAVERGQSDLTRLDQPCDLGRFRLCCFRSRADTVSASKTQFECIERSSCHPLGFNSAVMCY